MKKRVEGLTVSSTVTIVILCLGSQRGVFVQKQITRKKEDLRHPYVQALFTHPRHTQRLSGSVLSRAAYARDDASVSNNSYGR